MWLGLPALRRDRRHRCHLLKLGIHVRSLVFRAICLPGLGTYFRCLRSFDELIGRCCMHTLASPELVLLLPLPVFSSKRSKEESLCSATGHVCGATGHADVTAHAYHGTLRQPSAPLPSHLLHCYLSFLEYQAKTHSWPAVSKGDRYMAGR